MVSSPYESLIAVGSAVTHLVHPKSSDDGYTFPTAEEPAVDATCKGNVMGSRRPAHGGGTPQVPPLQHTCM